MISREASELLDPIQGGKKLVIGSNKNEYGMMSIDKYRYFRLSSIEAVMQPKLKRDDVHWELVPAEHLRSLFLDLTKNEIENRDLKGSIQ